MIFHTAIFSLYPNVVTIIGNTAFDVNENEINYDLDAVKAKSIELQAAEDARLQTSIDAKQSALNKLMALGLTEEEALALGVK